MKYKGEVLGISSIALWGLFPIVTIFTYEYISAIYSIAFSSLFGIIFFLFFFLKNKERKFFKRKKGWQYLIAASVLNGIIFYAIIFYGLKHTDAINASIFLLTFGYFSAPFPSYENLIPILPYLAFSGIILFGLSKYFFIEALKYISLPRLSSFITLYPICTILYSIILFGKFPNPEQIIGLLPMGIGILIFFDRIKIRKFSIIKPSNETPKN